MKYQAYFLKKKCYVTLHTVLTTMVYLVAVNNIEEINNEIKGGSINYHRKVLFMLDGLRFVILRSFLGSICLFVQSYSSLYSFTHKQIDHQKEPRNLTKLIYRNALNRKHENVRVT